MKVVYPQRGRGAAPKNGSPSLETGDIIYGKKGGRFQTNN